MLVTTKESETGNRGDQYWTNLVSLNLCVFFIHSVLKSGLKRSQIFTRRINYLKYCLLGLNLYHDQPIKIHKCLASRPPGRLPSGYSGKHFLKRKDCSCIVLKRMQILFNGRNLPEFF
jgi:hypothetical protein